MDRKDFLVKTCALCGVASTLAFIDSCNKTSLVSFTIELSNPANSALLRDGGYVIQSGVFVQKTATGYNALSQSCTHRGCTISYTGGTAGLFKCPCHGGVFDVHGNVMKGPPPSPLSKFTVTQNGSVLTVTG